MTRFFIIAASVSDAETAARELGGELMIHYVSNDPETNPGPMIYLPGQKTGEGIPVKIIPSSRKWNTNSTGERIEL